jgi:hypothetical protein
MLMGDIDHGSTVRPEIEKLRLPQPPSKYLQRFTFAAIEVRSKGVAPFSESPAQRDSEMDAVHFTW